MSGAKRLFLVEDHPIVRLGMKRLILEEGDLDVCGEADNLTTAVDGIVSTRPDLVLLDLNLRDGDGGFELLRRLKTIDPFLPSLVVSMYDVALFADRALRTGARGYIMKTEATKHLTVAIRRVLEGEIYLSPAETARVLNKHFSGLANAGTTKRLSVRELEVIQLIGQNFSSRQIAEKFHLSVKTVETHRTHILRKLNLADAAELRTYALQLNDAPIVKMPRAMRGQRKRMRSSDPDPT
jgi:DNA-binding NarL/FixJ family response regulator